jgi:hypothetical protein
MIRRRVMLPLLIAGFGLVAASGPARAQALVADLTSHLVAITTGFTGTSVVLFGATATWPCGARARWPRSGSIRVK